MIGVKGAENLKLIITTDVGLEKLVCIDVENIFLLSSIAISCMPLENSGISAILSTESVDPFYLAKVISSRYVRGYWAIPIQRVCRASYEEITKASIELLLLSTVNRPSRIIGICRKRGWYVDSCSSLLRYVGNMIESLGIAEVDFHSYEYVLRIEIVQNIAGLTLYRRGYEDLFKIRKLFR